MLERELRESHESATIWMDTCIDTEKCLFCVCFSPRLGLLDWSREEPANHFASIYRQGIRSLIGPLGGRFWISHHSV